jgi:hypothetical protein
LNLNKFKNGPNKLIIDGEVNDLSEKGESLEKINIKYLNKSIKFLIDLNMNNNSILKKNDNPNIILSNYYANNSINYKKEHLDLNLIEPFRKYYNSFWNKN